jgi:transaldolase
MYVEKLVAPHTVDTMPLETIDAYQDHGLVLPVPFGVMEIEAAAKTLERLASIGIDMDDVTDVLEREGVEKFSKSWHDLLAEIVRKRG